MNLQQSLARARHILEDNNIEDASLEGEVLLRHVLGIDRAQLYLERDQRLDPEKERLLFEMVARRVRGEPSAYITGHREFYGLDFYVDPGVLIPRPESELLVDKAREIAGRRPLKLADIGTGCGAIAISLALNLPEAEIYAIDISPKALEVARRNCERHGVVDRVRLLRGDMLRPLAEPLDIIVANLPYVPRPEIPDAGPLSYEPREALDGGPEGMDQIVKLCTQAAGRMNPGGYLLLEIGQGQANKTADIMHNVFPDVQVEIYRDLGNIERVVSLRLTEDVSR